LTVERRTCCPGTNLSSPFKGLRALSNKLFSGDCLDVMRTLPEECCDLIYLDPLLPLQCHLQPAVYLPYWGPSRRGPQSYGELKRFDYLI